MKRFVNAWTIAAVVLAVVGWGPLIVIIALAEAGLYPDPNPNPIGPGLLYFFTSPVVFALFAIGIVVGLHRTRSGSVQLPASMRHKLQQKQLTASQQLYIASGSFGGGAGILYFLYMGVPGAFFAHPMNIVYWPHTVAHARQYAWQFLESRGLLR